MPDLPKSGGLTTCCSVGCTRPAKRIVAIEGADPMPYCPRHARAVVPSLRPAPSTTGTEASDG